MMVTPLRRADRVFQREHERNCYAVVQGLLGAWTCAL